VDRRGKFRAVDDFFVWHEKECSEILFKFQVLTPEEKL
jgi:hypothetical protein